MKIKIRMTNGRKITMSNNKNLIQNFDSQDTLTELNQNPPMCSLTIKRNN